MPITFHKHVLPNGLTIIAECDPDAHTSACGFFVRTGARDESPTVMGVSHFLEHMMFKGTDTLSADDINRGFDELGARNNAFTSNEMTCFYAHVLPEHLGSATELLGKMMRPALRVGDFDTEKGVILEEIAMYKDNPFWVLYEACVERHYPNHPMSHRVLGTNETITALSRDQMAGYFEHRYSADTTTVAFAGRVDFGAVVEQIESLCASWPRTGAVRDSKSPPIWEGSFEIRDEKVSRAYMLGMSLAPSAQDPRRYAAAMLAQILGGSDNSRLHWALIETGLADEAQAAHDPHDGTGEYYVYCSCDPENATECWSVVEREIANLSDSLTEDDLMRLRNKLATAVTLGGERPHDRMHRIGRLWTLLGEYRTLEEELERINSVTLADLRAVAAAYPISRMTVGRLEPATPAGA
ncbi:MAG: insulinase family protein [Phycisphaeraceae bacterium]|nr:insulinase family protein [Phycisphaeraceae bacterium]